MVAIFNYMTRIRGYTDRGTRVNCNECADSFYRRDQQPTYQESTSQKPHARRALYRSLASSHCLTLQKTLAETLITQEEHSLLHIQYHAGRMGDILSGLPASKNPNVKPLRDNVVCSGGRARGVHRRALVWTGDTYEN